MSEHASDFALAWRFLDGCGAGTPSEWLEARLRQLVSEARAAWPALAIGDQAFVAHLAGRVAADSDLKESLAELHAADLYLACGCALGDARALAAFDRLHLSPQSRALARVRRFPELMDEVRQQLRTRLLIGSPPRIASYQGLGALHSWVQIAAQRILLNLNRSSSNRRRTERGMVPGGVSDPELEMIRARHAEDLDQALRGALALLTARQRHLLRLHYFDGIGLKQLGRLYHVDRRTASRWVAAARELLLDETKRALRARLQLSASSLDSLLRLLTSRLAISLDGLLT